MSCVLCDSCGRLIDVKDDPEAYCGYEQGEQIWDGGRFVYTTKTVTATSIDCWLCWWCRK